MICEICGNEMVIREGKFGKFYACTGYPDCTNTKPVQQDAKVPVVKPGFVPKSAESGSKREFHLTPEQVNTNAFELALRWVGTDSDWTRVRNLAVQIKEFIENGN